MPAENNQRAIHRALVDRILHGEGRTSVDQRTRACTNADLPEPLQTLLDKVALQPARVTDTDFATATAGGFSEDQLFELVICAAVGESTRQYEAGLAALAEAIAKREIG